MNSIRPMLSSLTNYLLSKFVIMQPGSIYSFQTLIGTELLASSLITQASHSFPELVKRALSGPCYQLFSFFLSFYFAVFSMFPSVWKKKKYGALYQIKCFYYSSNTFKVTFILFQLI